MKHKIAFIGKLPKKRTDFKKQGRINRRKGSEFERNVRRDLESQGWIVIKNPNNVREGKFAFAKPKFNPFTKSLMMNSSGFPDFVCFQNLDDLSKIIVVECKSNGYLSKEEKEKCVWLLKNKVFLTILIASKDGKGIKYREFEK